MKKGNGKKAERINVRSDGTIDRTYHITGAGESYYTNNQAQPLTEKNGFSQSDFEGALRSASRRTSAPASRKTGT